MSQSANVLSIEAIRDFEAALIQFYEVASRTTGNMSQQSQHMLQWLEMDRPVFWKRQVEIGHDRLAEARTRLTQCMMRRTGDFKPSCFDEKKALERAKRDLEFARAQINIVKQWIVKSRKESEEFNGRQAQLTRLLEGDIPRMVALLRRIVEKLDQYTNITTAEAMSLVTSSLADDTDSEDDATEEATSTDTDGSESGTIVEGEPGSTEEAAAKGE